VLVTSSKLQKQFISRHLQSVRLQLSHKLEVFYEDQLSLSLPCWQSSVAHRPVLITRLSSDRRWYLGWVEMSSRVQA